MSKKLILLIEDDPKTEAVIREMLGREYRLQTVKDFEGASEYLAETPPHLILIDFDLKNKDGLQIYRELRPQQKVIMLSASGNVPLAVTATKQGIVDFLRKPLNADELRGAVDKSLLLRAQKLCWQKGQEWMQGKSAVIQQMLQKIGHLIENKNDALLMGGSGISKKSVAEFIHANSGQCHKKIVEIDLASFSKESLESHFWANIKRLVTLPESNSLQRIEDACGTLYLEGFDQVDAPFQQTIIQYFKNNNKNIVLILGSSSALAKTDGLTIINIPSINQRKEDIPFLINFYMQRASNRFNKDVKFVSAQVLSFLYFYDFSGNYIEFEKMIDQAVLLARGEHLETKNFPITYAGYVRSMLEQALMKNLSLNEAKLEFEKKLYALLLEKSEGNESAVAQLLDIPKSVLLKRFQNLSD